MLENSRWLCPFYRFRHRSITFSSSFSPFPYFPPLFFFSSRQECHIARESFKKSLQGSFKISINIKNWSPIFLYTVVSIYHKAREMWTNYHHERSVWCLSDRFAHIMTLLQRRKYSVLPFFLNGDCLSLSEGAKSRLDATTFRVSRQTDRGSSVAVSDILISNQSAINRLTSIEENWGGYCPGRKGFTLLAKFEKQEKLPHVLPSDRTTQRRLS